MIIIVYSMIIIVWYVMVQLNVLYGNNEIVKLAMDTEKISILIQ